MSKRIQVLYCADIIERWGTGTLNIMDWCRENHAPVSTWEERAGSVVITFMPAAEFEENLGGQTTPVTTPVDDVDVMVSKEVARLLPLCETPKGKQELMAALGLRNA